MKPGWEESEFVICDLQAAARYIKPGNPAVAGQFLEAVYDTFAFLAQHPGAGRTPGDLGFPEVRSWRVRGFRRFPVFYRELPDRVQIWRVLYGARDLQREILG